MHEVRVLNKYDTALGTHLQEEFVDWHLDAFALELGSFNHQLMDWLVYYNSERPHWTLQLQSPMQYLLNLLQLQPTESSMWWTDTGPCQKIIEAYAADISVMV